jgi:hypothetical protein
MKKSLFTVIVLLNTGLFAQTTEARLQEARILFYKSVEHKEFIPLSVELWKSLESDSGFQGRALTYMGALTALKGKHAFWPHDKLKYTQKGLALMDQGRDKSPDDIETLFIHSSTCYFLPFFFKRAEDAQKTLKKIAALLPEKSYQYDTAMVKNVINFILQHAHLDAQEQESLNLLQATINRDEN